MKISKPPATFGSLCGIPVFIICISTFGMHPIFQTNKTASLQFCFGEEDNTVWIQVCMGGHSCVDVAESLLPSPCKLSWFTMAGIAFCIRGLSWKVARHYSRTQCWQLKNKKQASKQTKTMSTLPGMLLTWSASFRHAHCAFFLHWQLLFGLWVVVRDPSVISITHDIQVSLTQNWTTTFWTGLKSMVKAQICTCTWLERDFH